VWGKRLPIARNEPRATDGANAVEVLGRQAAEDLLHDVITKEIH
jgi:hypothetical protein